MKNALSIFIIFITACTMNSKNNQTVKKYEWYASGNAPELFPTILVYGNFMFSDRKPLYIPESMPFYADWGEAVSMHILNDGLFPAPSAIEISWLSVIENQFYSLEADLPKEKIENLLAEINEETKEQKYNFIVAGMAPYGGLAVWLSGNGIETEVAWFQAEPIDVDMKDFAPVYPSGQKEYSESVLKGSEKAFINFKKNGLPDRMLFERYMQKFNYRITPKFENEEAVFEEIDMYYYNGEYNETNSGEHISNSMRAKPYKIVINWSIGKNKFGGYFWTDEKKIIDAFSKFYGDNTSKDGNLIIEVAESNDQFKFSLQDASAIVEIPVEDMQFIIFKNKFEFYRSENYNRPQGGWRD